MTRSLQTILHQLTLGWYTITKPLVYDSEKVKMSKNKKKSKRRAKNKLRRKQ